MARSVQGSGLLIRTFHGRQFILTCAHNVISIDEDDPSDRRKLTSIVAYLLRDGEENWIRRWNISTTFIPESYDGKCTSGFDIAVLVCDEELPYHQAENHYSDRLLSSIETYK